MYRWTELKAEQDELAAKQSELKVESDLAIVGPVIDTLVASEVDQRFINSLDSVCGFEALKLSLIWVDGRQVSSPDVSPIGNLSTLKHLEINTFSLEHVESGKWIAGLKGLQSLKIDARLNRSAFESIRELSKLEYLDCGMLSANDLSLITNPRIDTLILYGSYKDSVTDNLLMEWLIPPALTVARLPHFWLPEPLHVYHRRLPKMPEEERAIYSSVRLLPEMKSDSESLHHIRRLALVHGGALVSGAESWHNALQGRIDLQRLYRQINNQQASIESSMVSLAKLTLLSTRNLELQQRIPQHNAKAVYAAVTPFLDQNDDDVWEVIRPKSTRHRNAEADQIIHDSIAAMGDITRLQQAPGIHMHWERETNEGDLPEKTLITMVPSNQCYHESKFTFDFFENKFLERHRIISDGKMRLNLSTGAQSRLSSDPGFDFHWSRQQLLPLILIELLEDDVQLKRIDGRLVDGKSVETVQMSSHGKVIGELQFDPITKLLLYRREGSDISTRRRLLGSTDTSSEINTLMCWSYTDYQKTNGFTLPRKVSFVHTEGKRVLWDRQNVMKDWSILDSTPENLFVLDGLPPK